MQIKRETEEYWGQSAPRAARLGNIWAFAWIGLASLGTATTAHGWAFTLSGEDNMSLSVVGVPGIFDGAEDISADGRYVVGSSGGFGSFDGYVVDTTTGNHTLLSPIPGGVPGLVAAGHETQGRAISGDGSVAVGLAEDLSGRFRGAAYPQAAAGGTGGAALLTVFDDPGQPDPDDGDLMGGSVFAEPLGASMDGSVIVGRSDGLNGGEAFRWTAATGMEGLGDLPGGIFNSSARGVSNDGTVIVGEASTAGSFAGFRWTEEDGMVSLGGSPNHGTPASQVMGVSGDGSTIVGLTRFVPTSFNQQPGYWTEDTGWVDLGPLPAGEAVPSNDRFGFAHDASLDGSVIVGEVRTTRAGQEAFIWTEDTGVLTLFSLLEDAEIDVEGWTFNTLRAVSDDGRTIAGSATTDIGSVEAYVVTLPDFLFAGGGLTGDFTGNGQVEQGDLNLVLNNWGGARGTWDNADGFATANVDQEELNAVLNNWGASGAPSFEGFAVPEPGAALIIGIGAGLRRRRRTLAEAG